MHYERRLKFINYIKEKFDLKNTPINKTMLFYFNDYENFEEIKVKIDPDSDEEETYHRLRRGQEVGSCIAFKNSHTDNFLFFEDTHLMYRENIFLSECTLNYIHSGYRCEPSLDAELDELVLLLQGKQNPQRISNC